MNRPDPHTVTRLLDDVRAGCSEATEALLPLVYDELHGLASAMFSSERRGHTLQPTALVNEAWLRLAGHLSDRDDAFEDRRHFMVVAARAMRRVLTDNARRHRSQKRGGGWGRVTLDTDFGSAGAQAGNSFGLVEFHDALARLAELDARQAEVVELRLLGGLTIAETAQALGVSHFTVENDWFTAKAWLRKQLGNADE